MAYQNNKKSGRKETKEQDLETLYQKPLSETPITPIRNPYQKPVSKSQPASPSKSQQVPAPLFELVVN